MARAKKQAPSGKKKTVAKQPAKKAAARRLLKKPAEPPAKKSTSRFITGTGRPRLREADLIAPMTPQVVSRPPAIPVSQWTLPAGVHPDGSYASLAEVVSDPVPTRVMESLSGQQKKELIAERIRLQPDYPTLHMMGFGEVNRERAIAEVKSGSAAGKFIMESEQNVIQLLKKMATTS